MTLQRGVLDVSDNYVSVMAVVNDLPFFSAQEINWAAEVFKRGDQSSPDWPLAVAHVNAWRTAHEAPISLMRVALTVSGMTINDTCIVASRLKRLPTIIDKCSRLPSDVTLWEMQDLGGLRAILDTPEEVLRLAARLEKRPPVGFEFLWRNDYINKPKGTGYRSVHLVYAYLPGQDENQQLKGLRIEVQIRSKLQHSWATANEIAGTMLRQDLKSNKGDPKWRRWFTLAGSAIARKEGTPPGSNVPADDAEFRGELDSLEQEVRAFERLTAYSQAPRFVNELEEPRGVGYAVLAADIKQRMLNITIFGGDQFLTATTAYQAAEKEHAGDRNWDTVLVHLDKLAQLEEAYPNYFAETGLFLHAVYPDWEKRLNDDGTFG